MKEKANLKLLLLISYLETMEHLQAVEAVKQSQLSLNKDKLTVSYNGKKTTYLVEKDNLIFLGEIL